VVEENEDEEWSGIRGYGNCRGGAERELFDGFPVD